MNSLLEWLLDDRQSDLFNVLVALGLQLLFLGVITLVLWPLGQARLSLTLAKGYGWLWLAVFISALALNSLQRLLRMDMYHRANGFTLSTLAVSGWLQVGWAAFAALTFTAAVAGGPLWLAVVLYGVGLLSCLMAYYTVSSIYSGQIYQLITMPLFVASFVLFCFWPASANFLYGWLFQHLL